MRALGYGPRPVTQVSIGRCRHPCIAHHTKDTYVRNSIRRTLAVVATTATALTSSALLAPAPASAHPDRGASVTAEGVIARDGQHGDPEGHLPATQNNIDLVGKQAIDGAGEGRVADVTAFGNYAYLTVRDPEGCSDAGVAIMDISNPADPAQVGFIDATEGSFPGEGAQVLDVKTKSFTGQVLLFNNEICGETGKGGVSLWDVTNPTRPVVLSAHAGDTTADGDDNPALNDIHSALGWTDGKKAYAAIVDNAETADLDILDISNPRSPVLVSESDLNDFDVLQEDATPLGANSFLHDIEVQKIKGVMTMVASYWDGGWTLLDVDDPANPVYLRDFDYPAVDAETGLTPSEGNAHQAEFSPDGKFIIGTDEDFNPYRLTLTSAGRDFQAAQGSDTPQLDADTRLTGPTTYIGTACPVQPATATTPTRPADVFPAAVGDGQIAVIQRGVCSFSQKAQTAEAAGYDGVVLFNSVRPDGCATIVTPFVEAGIPVVSVGRDTAYALFGATYNDAACLAGGAAAAAPFAVGAKGTAVSVAAVFDGWGYVRLLDTATLSQIDTYAIPESLDPKFADGFGDLSVHEVAVDPKKKGLAYLSYYSGGLRVVEYGKDGIREVGSFIDQGGNNFWGVEYHLLPTGKGNGKANGGPAANELILASDRDSGLYVFRYPGGK